MQNGPNLTQRFQLPEGGMENTSRPFQSFYRFTDPHRCHGDYSEADWRTASFLLPSLAQVGIHDIALPPSTGSSYSTLFLTHVVLHVLKFNVFQSLSDKSLYRHKKGYKYLV